MALMLNQPAHAYTPPQALAVDHPSMWYPLHESAGTVVRDALGFGDDLVCGGTTTNIWSQWGGLTGSAVPDTRLVAVTPTAAAQSILRLDNIVGQQILSGFWLRMGGSADLTGAGAEVIWSFGRNSAAHGYWGVELRNDERIGLAFTPVGATVVYPSIPGAHARTGVTTWIAVLIEVIGLTSDTVSVRASVQGTDPSTWTLEPLYLSSGGSAPGGGTPPGPNLGNGLVLGAMALGPSSYSRYLGQCSAGTTRIGGLWFQRRSSIDEALASLAFADMLASRFEFPRALRRPT